VTVSKKKAVQDWRNTDLPFRRRVRDLIGRMTLGERVAQLNTKAPPIERFGIGTFAWNGECVHGLCSSGRATQFPVVITFDYTRRSA
jgi:beta-glucosidase